MRLSKVERAQEKLNQDTFFALVELAPAPPNFCASRPVQRAKKIQPQVLSIKKHSIFIGGSLDISVS